MTSQPLSLMNVEKKPVLGDISIVIPTLGRPILEECLARIASGSHWPGRVILIHQGDAPIVMEWSRVMTAMGIETDYLSSTERGKPAAINLAFARTQTRFVCMIDDDCFVEPDWLHNMHIRLHKYPDWIVTGRVEPAGNETVAIVQIREASVQFRPRLKFDLFVGGNMGAAMDVVRRVGLFDEDPLLRSAAEDVEWGYRALRSGVPIAYAPEVAVSHFGWRDDKGKSDRFKVYGHGHGAFYGKYLRQGDWFILARAIAHFFRALRRWVMGRIKGETELAILGRAYFVNMLPGILAGMRSKVRPGTLN
jgi:GT2 family glycosyltransferase